MNFLGWSKDIKFLKNYEWILTYSFPRLLRKVTNTFIQGNVAIKIPQKDKTGRTLNQQADTTIIELVIAINPANITTPARPRIMFLKK